MNPPHPRSLPPEAVSQYEKLTFGKGGEAVGWKRFRAVTISRSDSRVPSI
jgi:hypothetical protein